MNKEQQAAARQRSRAAILRAGLAEARRAGVLSMSRREVAGAAGVAPSLISHYFGSMGDFQNEVVAEAVRVRDLLVIRQGIAANFPAALAAPQDIRQAAIMS